MRKYHIVSAQASPDQNPIEIPVYFFLQKSPDGWVELCASRVDYKPGERLIGVKIAAIDPVAGTLHPVAYAQIEDLLNLSGPRESIQIGEVLGCSLKPFGDLT
jgi:hypothetical protein